MLSPESLEANRRMTPGQRLKLTFEATRAAIPYLFRSSKEVVDRRFELMRRQNDERNKALLEGLARAEALHDER